MLFLEQPKLKVSFADFSMLNSAKLPSRMQVSPGKYFGILEIRYILQLTLREKCVKRIQNIEWQDRDP